MTKQKKKKKLDVVLFVVICCSCCCYCYWCSCPCEYENNSWGRFNTDSGLAISRLNEKMHSFPIKQTDLEMIMMWNLGKMMIMIKWRITIFANATWEGSKKKNKTKKRKTMELRDRIPSNSNRYVKTIDIELHLTSSPSLTSSPVSSSSDVKCKVLH